MPKHRKAVWLYAVWGSWHPEVGIDLSGWVQTVHQRWLNPRQQGASQNWLSAKTGSWS
jgi:hypothetical protein